MVGCLYRYYSRITCDHTRKEGLPTKICWLGRFIIVKAIYKLAGKSLPGQRKRRGSKRYATASKIASWHG
ncbi:MAG: hypothetical protein ACTSUJ_09160 [Candidatus Njordarchaeales archaeon]